LHASTVKDRREEFHGKEKRFRDKKERLLKLETENNEVMRLVDQKKALQQECKKIESNIVVRRRD
jgi:hypothetical protein